MTLRLAARPDPEAQRRAAEQRVRHLMGELGDALVDLAAMAAVPEAKAPVELLSVAEFCRRAGISRSTAWLWVQDGTIGSLLVHGRRIVPSSEIERLASLAAARATHKVRADRPEGGLH